MDASPSNTIYFQRSNFATPLPADAFYSPSHYWLARDAAGLWRIGFTKFAVRMLGELVAQAFETPVGAAIKPGALLGWVEGFKAISDIYSVIDGVFQGGNPRLEDNLEAIHASPYGDGWLYQAAGEPDPLCMPALAYAELLNATIDRLLAQQQAQGPDASLA